MKYSGAPDPNFVPEGDWFAEAVKRPLNYNLPIPSVDRTVNILLAMPPGAIQRTLESELVRRGYRPILVSRADQLLGLLQVYPSRLLILDRLAGVANPYIFCKECLALHPSLNILLLVDQLTNPKDARRLMALRFGALDMVSRDEAHIGRLVERIEVLIQPPNPVNESAPESEAQKSEGKTDDPTPALLEPNRPGQGKRLLTWFSSMVEALQRPIRKREGDVETLPNDESQKIGARLVNRKLITEEQLAMALQEQKILGLKLGEVCIYAGWLSYADLLLVLDRPQHLLGQILVSSGYLSFAQLRLALQEQQETQQHLATIIHNHHWVSKEVLVQALHEQQRLQQLDITKDKTDYKVAEDLEAAPDLTTPPLEDKDLDDWINLTARRASILYSRNQLDEASKLLQAGLARSPKHPGLLLGYSVVLSRQGQFAQAARLLETLTRVQPESAAALTLLGTVSLSLQDRPRARQAYARAYVLLSKQKRTAEASRIRQVIEQLEPK
ncbi:tetratricopeptide repeat protein [Leptolyngbya sp. FACHB-261]|uniref:tetratricopeptide repeat protein n=1 Tax=Leptolyngbya sp. FACHB-261 TaxID=2692806 RepID=UPI0016858233|nr:tetratricopeptide repeat protein [Leptolyngbya sp. FACHB-261]MBD2103137.1 tetratricopeptide repeat protein [Leptolyngbya sp. FACHB-261]